MFAGILIRATKFPGIFLPLVKFYQLMCSGSGFIVDKISIINMK